MDQGDHIFIWCGSSITPAFTHHGIDCGDGSVIHFTGNHNKKIQFVINKTSLVSFAANNVKGKKEVYALDYEILGIPFDEPYIVIQRAESCLGEAQYNLFKNNCEHFDFFCKTGIKKSYQIDKLENNLVARGVFSLYVWSPIGILMNHIFGTEPRKYRKIQVR